MMTTICKKKKKMLFPRTTEQLKETIVIKNKVKQGTDKISQLNYI